MVDDKNLDGGAAPCALVERLRRDSGFRALLESDTQAALQVAGIVVPSGVQVRYAPNAAIAVQMTLDRIPLTPERALSDSELAGVTGGIGGGDEAADIQSFLSAIKRRVS